MLMKRNRMLCSDMFNDHNDAPVVSRYESYVDIGLVIGIGQC